MRVDGMARRRKGGPAGTFLALALLAGCSTTETPTDQQPVACPDTLAFVKPHLVTPYDQLATFIGPDELEATFNRPVEEMIANSGGIDPAILAGQGYVKEYQDILAHEQQTREEYRGLGKDDAWIDLYLSSVADGVTINQGFVDAVTCRKNQLQQS
jgi:hypothetical protein